MAEFTACVKKALFHFNLWIKPCPHWEQHTWLQLCFKTGSLLLGFSEPIFFLYSNKQRITMLQLEVLLWKTAVPGTGTTARTALSLPHNTDLFAGLKRWLKPVVELSTFWKTQQNTSIAIPANPSREASYKGCYFGGEDMLPPQW